MARLDRLFLTCSLLTLLLAPVSQLRAERSTTTPTGWQWYYGVSADFIREESADTSSRVIDIEVDSTDPYRFNVAFVHNRGVHEKTSWWYYGLTAAGMSERLETNQARLIDIETYFVNGRQRFACVMVRNVGTDTRSWWWYHGLTAQQLTDRYTENRARIIDIETYNATGRPGSERLFAAVMIPNTGANASNWWWYQGASSEQLADLVDEHDARILDLDTYESSGGRRFAAVLVPNTGPEAISWWWYRGQTASQVTEHYQQNGARIVDVEAYQVDGRRLFAVLMINNSNALTTRIASILGYGSNGCTGLYLADVDGSTYAGLQTTKQFETASTIKVLHHLHSMLSVQNGDVALGDQVAWCPTSSNTTTPKNGCPQAPCGQTIALRWGLNQMMINSDNRTTDAVRRFFGFPAINATRVSLGMDDSILQHVIGCGSQIIANPNLMTLRDAGTLYGRVAEGTILSDPNRETFWSLMLNESNSGLIGDLRDIVDAEASSLGMSQQQADDFADAIRLAYKAGSYNWQSLAYRSVCGWVQLPICAGGALDTQDYVFGLFFHEATDGGAAGSAIGDARAEIFRERIRAHLQSFSGPRACVPVTSSLFRRGDVNGDGSIDIADGTTIFDFLFLGGRAPRCEDAADANDDGSIDMADGVKVLNILFLGDRPPSGTILGELQSDPTDDRLGCEFYPVRRPV